MHDGVRTVRQLPPAAVGHGVRAGAHGAGGPPGTADGRDRRRPHPVGAEGLLLGIDPKAEYPETEFELLPGATLAMYTDGLIEAPGIDLDEAKAGMADRLAALHHLPVERAADELTSKVSEVPHRRDDTALLLLRADAA
nr:serine/threonine-protein phosphatase [Nocardiopsis sp. CNR-923]